MLSAAGRAGLGLYDIHPRYVLALALGAGATLFIGRPLRRRHLELLPAFAAFITPCRWPVRAGGA